MKKFLPALVLLGFLTVMLVPMIVSAQVTQCTLKHDITDFDPVCTAGATVTEAVTKAWGMCCLLDAVYTVTDWIFFIIIVVVGLLVIWGAFTIVTAGGAPEKATSGRNFILYALIGLAVALLAKAIPSIVSALLGV